MREIDEHLPKTAESHPYLRQQLLLALIMLMLVACQPKDQGILPTILATADIGLVEQPTEPARTNFNIPPNFTRVVVPDMAPTQTALETPTPELPVNFYDGDVLIYPDEIQQVLDELKAEYGFEIVTPARWSETEGNIEGESTGGRVLPWTAEDIAVLEEVLPELPPIYHAHSRSVKQVLLIKTAGSRGGPGGRGYARQIILYLPESYNIYSTDQGLTNAYFHSPREHLRATIVHEWTHLFTEAYPEVLVDWIETMGWYRDDRGEWQNSNPDTLIHQSRADIYPGEDLATSVSLFFLDPNYVSLERREFIENHPLFADWPILGAN